MDDGQPQPRDWLAQARRGVIELAVLVLIGRMPHYGYEIAVALSHWQPLAATEGTLYPLLRRLQREGLVDSFWQESNDGPPRKYYRLTPAGAALRDVQLHDWQRLTKAVADLRAGRFEDEEFGLFELEPPPTLEAAASVELRASADAPTTIKPRATADSPATVDTRATADAPANVDPLANADPSPTVVDQRPIANPSATVVNPRPAPSSLPDAEHQAVHPVRSTRNL
jgi:PadR family transcriptional regulator PadR